MLSLFVLRIPLPIETVQKSPTTSHETTPTNSTIIYSSIQFPISPICFPEQVHVSVHIDLVGGLEHEWIMTFHILGISSSHLTNSYFSEG
jgi:hypothetical protein